MKIAALITAKSQSIRVPGKNFKLLGEIPLYRRTTDFVLANQDLFSVVGFSSDNVDEFAIPSTFCPIQRPEYLCNEEASHIHVIRHAFHNMEYALDEPLDYVILFQPTNPIRIRRYLVDVIKKLTSFKPDKVYTLYFDDNLAEKYIQEHPASKPKQPPLIRSGNLYAYSRGYVLSGQFKTECKLLIPKRLGYNINVDADFGIVESMLVGEW